MRHGEAKTHAAKDELRELTATGINEVKSVSEKLLDEQFDLIIVSPYVRAQQTAKCIIGNNKNAQVIESNLIIPEGNAQDAHNYLDGLLAEQAYKKVLIVSHMPLVSYLVAELTSDNYMPIFQTAALLKIDYHLEKMKGDVLEMVCPFADCISQPH